LHIKTGATPQCPIGIAPKSNWFGPKDNIAGAEWASE
jgi:hypothetical protein